VRLRITLALGSCSAVLLTSSLAAAQRHHTQPPPDQSSDQQGKPSDEEEERPVPRTEPEIPPPADPLLISPAAQARIGSDFNGGPPSPTGTLEQTQWFPYYEERRGDYRVRLLPPFYIEHTRGLPDPSQKLYGVPQTEDTEGLYGLLYYRRRSLKLDMDVVFPGFWRVREGDSHTLVLGPLVHREAPGENDNWLAPLYFAGSRKDGGYFHMPLLLTTSHWSPSGAFTLVGPYFRDRTGANESFGVAPFFFHGDNGNVDGNRRTYTLVPPLLFYHGEREVDSSSTTIVGPVISQSDAKRDTFDVAPFYWHIVGKPQSGGVSEEHTTLFPFFHYGHDPDKTLFILPGYYRRISQTTDTLLTPFFSQAQSRNGSTSLTAIGPVVPLWWSYRDRDLDVRAFALAPFFYTSDSPTGHDWLTPLIGRFESYGESRTWWFFPTLTINSNKHGWENDFHPLIYTGRSDDSSHTVIAPVFWDFANAKGRTTIAPPLYFRFASTENNSVTQVAANTLYIQKQVAGGLDWQFHLLPLFSYGENPSGYFWNVLFGLAGFSRDGAHTQVRALWIPINSGPQVQTLAGAPPPPGTLQPRE
jgi:hypothetical protein